MQERVERVIQEEQLKWGDVELQKNRYRQEADQAREENMYLKR